MHTNVELTRRKHKFYAQGVAVAHEIYAAHADNSTITDVEGTQYIDFTAGISSLNTGHRHPYVLRAIQQQLEKFTHTAFQAIPYESAIELAERLSVLAPCSGHSKVAFFTTGSEAVENAIKIARFSTKRSAIISFSGGFHGRTFMSLSLTGKMVPYKAGFGPMAHDVFHIPFPAGDITCKQSLQAIKNLFKSTISPNQVAAIIFEPIQGEGGFNLAPEELVNALRDLCNKYGILLIADEIQTGIARTGKLFALEYFSAKADLITLAKSLGGGMPISAVVGRADLMDAPPPGALGGTFSANPLSVAAAHAVLDIVEKEKLCQRALLLGEILTNELVPLIEKNKPLYQLRGLGSMLAIEIFKSNDEPDPQKANEIVQKARSNGLLLLPCGFNNNVIRFMYPLTIKEKEFHSAIKILKNILN